MRSGINLENPQFATEKARAIFSRADLLWLYEFNRDLKFRRRSDYEEIVEYGRKYAGDLPIVTCERILSINGRGAVPSNPDVILERSFGTSYLPRVFGAMLSAGIVASYLAYPDSTEGWTTETDWADFRENQPIGVSPASSLKLHTRGTTAKDVEFVDYGEKYRVKRYVGKFTLDDQDIIDDKIGASQELPAQMGLMAASLRPDLVYSVLMSNPTLSDSVALFAAGRGNLLTSNTLSIPGLTAAETAIGTQKITDKAGVSRALNLRAGWLIVPRALRTTAKQIVTSANIVSGNTTPVGNRNPHDGEYMMRSDARLDVGVVDPQTGNTVAGSATKWFVACKDYPSIQVGFRRGTGRVPVIRANKLDQPGQWGIGWDIMHDIGVCPLDPRGILQSS
jgi:hypothetical protein